MDAAQCNRCWENVCQTYTERYNEPSDGLLNRSTQTGQRTVAFTSNWNPNATFEVVGANHSEFKEHPGTQVRLNAIFNGGSAPAFFQTARR